jgi:hypothetical protein
MVGQVLYDIFVVVVWVGLWGLAEGIIDRIAKDNANMRFMIYILISLFGIATIWIFDLWNSNQNTT